MRPILKGAVLATIVLACAGLLAAFLYIRTSGLSARDAPGDLEAGLARRLRAWAVPEEYRDVMNPVPANDESVRLGMEHFADHCAVCHANDGSGDSEFGRGMYPRPPDLRARPTQDLADGELFYVIEHGVRFTGMPAFATGTVEGEEESWHLVNFLRRLPDLTPAQLAEMVELNPRPPRDIRQEIEEERFLSGQTP